MVEGNCNDCIAYKYNEDYGEGYCRATEDFNDVENDDILPDFCPLRQGDIIIRLL